MGVLSGVAIHNAINDGDIRVDPFVPANLAPNSLDLTLGAHLLVYGKNYPLHQFCVAHWGGQDPSLVPPQCEPLDMRVDEATVDLFIPESGLVLYPGVLYLGTTNEFISTDKYVPAIEGRSSVARMGICAHLAAGWGDVSFAGEFTLELTAVTPVRVYAGVRICQVAFSDLTGPAEPYRGKYQGQTGPKKSALWRDFLPRT